MLKNFLLLGILIIPLGCGAGTAYLQSLTDPDITIPPKEGLFLLMPPDSSTFEEKVLAKNLRREMIRMGFGFTDNVNQADYILTFGLDKKEIPLTYFEPVISSNYSFGNYGKSNFNQTSFNSTYVPVQGTQLRKNIIAGLYEIDNNKLKLNQVWELYIGSSAELFNSAFENLPKQIINFYCKNYSSNKIYLDYPESYENLVK